MKKSKIIIISSIVVLYSLILSAFGAFGITVQTAVLWFVANVLPYIAMIIGYFFTIFIPIRVMQAIERNKEIKTAVDNDDLLQRHADYEKQLKNQIMNVLNNKEDVI